MKPREGVGITALRARALKIAFLFLYLFVQISTGRLFLCCTHISMLKNMHYQPQEKKIITKSGRLFFFLPPHTHI